MYVITCSGKKDLPTGILSRDKCGLSGGETFVSALWPTEKIERSLSATSSCSEDGESMLVQQRCK